ncbi:hypothetical protein [Alienimonas californiensis]|uniref:hypothetical protein n=1 Tax=Alienimonas californiensis TaxID=2527989 RepID=UPI0011A3C2BF|nr:hypothetical protein [Alienimonas californiensis]
MYADHEHEDRPLHYPESFPAAIAALRDRLPAIANGDARSAAEAADIAGWMPELAADSDATEAEWTPLAAGSRELAVLLPRVAVGEAEALERANATLDRLAAVVSEIGEEEFEVTPHEPHDHGDDHDR